MQRRRQYCPTGSRATSTASRASWWKMSWTCTSLLRWVMGVYSHVFALNISWKSFFLRYGIIISIGLSFVSVAFMIHHVWHTGLSFVNFCWLFEILEVMRSNLIPVTRVNQVQLQSVILENAKTSRKSKGTKWQPCRSVEENRSDNSQQVKSPFLKFPQGTVRFLDLSVKEPDYPKFPQGTVVRFPYLSVGEPDHPRKRPKLIFQGVSANPSSKHCLAARPHHPRRRLALHHQARPQVGRGQWGSSVPLFLVIKIHLDIDV